MCFLPEYLPPSEWAYDRTSHIGKLDEALDEDPAKGWTVVNTKDDWETIFPPKP